MIDYSYQQMSHDKRAYGALDGDNAQHCSRCNGRYAGSPLSLCPYCAVRCLDAIDIEIEMDKLK